MKRFYYYRRKSDFFIKNLGFLVFFLLFSYGTNAQCPTGNISLLSQAAVDNFVADFGHCTTLSGNLSIQGSTTNNLSGLSNIENITGELSITHTSSLVNLNGLSSLESIGGSLWISNNSQLQNIDSLSSLESVGGMLILNSNASLTNLDGLSSLENVNGQVNVQSNNVLTDISGLANINPQTILALSLSHNPQLSVCNIDSFCTYLATGSGVKYIQNNNTGCTSLAVIINECYPCEPPTNLTYQNLHINTVDLSWEGEGTFEVQWMLSHVGLGSGTIINNIQGSSYNLSMLNGGTAYKFYVRNRCENNQSNWIGPINFTTKLNCPGSQSLNTQTAINNFATNYGHCTSITGGLTISGNNITNLNGLSNLQNIVGSIAINNTTQLLNLDGLSSLTNINGQISITNNTSLNDISSLSGITSNITNLNISNNPQLSVCNIDIICNYLADSGTRTITNNNTTCLNINAVINECYSCEAPTNGTVTNLTNITANLVWEGEGSFDLHWGAGNFTPGSGSGTIINGIEGVSYNLSSLNANTQYRFYIRRDCTEIKTDWVGPFIFTTKLNCPTSQSFTTQAAINTFGTNYGHCKTLSATLTISGNNITNLGGLSNIESIGGNFSISNTLLENLDDLSSLENINGNISISSNTILTNISGLSSLESINGQIIITNNTILNNISGLSGINSTITNLNVSNNSQLSVCNIDTICNYLAGSGTRTITNNNTTCSNINAVINECYSCEAPTNGTVTNLTNILANLVWEGEGFFDIQWGVGAFTLGNGTIVSNISETSYSLSNLTANTTYRFYVRRDCDGIKTDWVGPFNFTTKQNCPLGNVVFSSQTIIDDFPNNYGHCTTLTGNIYIQGGTIVNLNGLSLLENVGGIFSIQNTQLEDLDDLLSLQNIGGPLIIYQNSKLTDLNGLSSIQSVTQLQIRSNAKLQNLNGLSSLQTVGGDFLYIESNPLLTNISDLENIDPTTIGGAHGLWIYNNPNLSVCSLNNFCTYLANPSSTHPRTIQQNKTGGNCTSSNVILANCIPSCEIPTTLTTTNLTYNSAILSWTSTGNLFDIEWGTQGFTQGNGTTVNGIENTSYALSSLTANTQYVFYVRQDCSVNESEWAGPYSFTTLLPICEIPTTLTVTNLTHNSATISWTSTGNNFDIEWGTQGFTQGNGTTISSIENTSYALYSLTPDTQYEFYVRRDCAVNESEWAGPYSFTTPLLCPLGDIHFQTQQSIDDFIINYPNCTYLSENVYVQGNDIEELNGLQNITGIGGDLRIISNPVLESLDGLNVLESVEGEIYITLNPLLQNLNGLNTLETAGSLFIDSNNMLENLVGLDGLIAVTGVVGIQYNPLLEDMNGLGSLETVTDGIHIVYNDGLTSLDGLDDLTQTGDFIIGLNPLLENLDGLSSLTTVNGELFIAYNESLTDISGLTNINTATITTGVYEVGLGIVGNMLLEVCNLPNFCEYLQGSGIREISGNAGDCVSQAAIANACILSGNCQTYTIWNGSQWSNGEPSTIKKAIIEGDLTLTSNLTACELLLNSGILTINSGVSLTVNGEIVNTQSANNFIIQSGGNLIQVDEVENTGAISVRRSTLIKHLDYTIWSSPVANQALQSFSPLTLANRIRIYDGQPSVNNWVITTGNFVSGKGYMFRAPNANDGSYAGIYTWTGTFTGIPENGNVTAEFNNLGTYQSIGNPYPSNIDREEFHNTNPNIGTLNFWTNTNSYDSQTGQYITNNWTTVNRSGDTVGPTGDEDNISNGVISAGQGFVAETNGVIQQAVFNNTMRTSNSGVFFRTIQNEKHRLWLDLTSGNQNHNQILVGYMEEATNNDDFGIDSELFGYTGSALYSLIENNQADYIIQGRSLPFNDYDVVSLGFRAVNDGSYTISLSDFDGLFAEGQDIFVKDNFTQTQQNLKDGGYTFVSETGKFDNRFEIVYRDSSLSVNNPDLSNNWIVYKQDNTFHIQTQGFEIKQVMVYDVLGRVVYDAKDINTSNHTFPSINGNQIFIVKINSTDNQTLSKKVRN